MTGKVAAGIQCCTMKSRRTQAGHRPTQFTRCNLARCRKARSKVDLDGCCSSFISSCLEALSFRARPTHHTPIRRLSYTHFSLSKPSHTSITATLLAHTQPFNCPLSGTTGVRKVKTIWILLKQETVSGSGISWAVCKSALRSRQITMPATYHSVFYRPDALPAAQPTASKH